MNRILARSHSHIIGKGDFLRHHACTHVKIIWRLSVRIGIGSEIIYYLSSVGISRQRYGAMGIGTSSWHGTLHIWTWQVIHTCSWYWSWPRPAQDSLTFIELVFYLREQNFVIICRRRQPWASHWAIQLLANLAQSVLYGGSLSLALSLAGKPILTNNARAAYLRWAHHRTFSKNSGSQPRILLTLALSWHLIRELIQILHLITDIKSVPITTYLLSVHILNAIPILSFLDDL
jgi:hypothetical protein